MIDFKERSHGLHGTPPSLDEQHQYNQVMEDGARQFVQLAVAMPQKLNRPKFYSDPRFKLFTTLQGYISTFTSTILPVIYSNLLKPGASTQRRKGALATMAALMALSYLSQGIKTVSYTHLTLPTTPYV